MVEPFEERLKERADPNLVAFEVDVGVAARQKDGAFAGLKVEDDDVVCRPSDLTQQRTLDICSDLGAARPLSVEAGDHEFAPIELPVGAFDNFGLHSVATSSVALKLWKARATAILLRAALSNLPLDTTL